MTNLVQAIRQILTMRRLQSTLKLGRNVRLAFPHHLTLGDHLYIGDDSFIQAQGGVVVGSHSILGSRVVILSVNHNFEEPASLPYDQNEIYRPVHIGEYVWIGMGSMICPGVTIGDAAVTLMGSVVTRDVPPLAIVGGNPAAIIGKRDEEKSRELMEKECSLLMTRKVPSRDL